MYDFNIPISVLGPFQYKGTGLTRQSLYMKFDEVTGAPTGEYKENCSNLDLASGAI